MSRGVLDHLSLSASAGSGKTYRLSGRYLQLIARDVHPSRILASTFTRAAAGEIRDRVLRRLAQAIEDPEARQNLRDELQLPGDEQTQQSQLRHLLRNLCKRVHRMQIRTLDSYFNGVVRTHALELGLPPGTRIIDEHEEDRLRLQAIGELLEDHNSQTLIELLRALTEGTTERSVTEVINRVVRELYGQFRLTSPAAWTWMKPRPTLSVLQLHDAIDGLSRMDPWDNRQRKSLSQDLQRLRSSGENDLAGWVEFYTKGLARAIAASTLAGEQPTFYNKPIESDLIDCYQPLLAYARDVFWNHLAHRTAATADVLSRFDSSFSELKARQRAVTFDDLTHFMIEAHRRSELHAIGFRLDARLHHLLLDEFQDTSLAQWQALAPIARDIIGSPGQSQTAEQTFFCVGDVKQSIYGWRGADPDILRELPRLTAGSDQQERVRVEHMATSYRSAQPVMDVVNRVFGNLPGNQAVSHHAQAVASWDKAFKEHQTKRRELPGYVELRTMPEADEEQDASDLRLAAAAKVAAEHHQANPRQTIAVLTRTNRAVGRVLFELGPTRLNIPARGSGGGSLLDAAAVNVMLDLIQLADHPGDSAAAFHVASSPLGPRIGLKVGGPRVRDTTRAVSRRIRRELVERGYARSINGWAQLIDAAADIREGRRLQQLIELADRFDRQATLRPRDFVEMARRFEVDDPAISKVSVLNIHQSKGLEYDLVILADLEEPIGDTKKQSLAVERSDVDGPATRVARWMPGPCRRAFEELENLYQPVINRLVLEDLCLLYVAMTRAKQGLLMLVNPPTGRGKPSKTLAGLLLDALAERSTPAADQVVYQHGEQSLPIAPDITPPAPPLPTDASSEELIDLADTARRPRRLLSPSKHTADHVEGALASVFRVAETEATDRGSVIHRLLEQVQWIETFQPDPQRLQSLARTAASRRSSKWIAAQVQAFMEMLQQPPIRQALSRDHSQATELWREQPFVFSSQEELLHGVIDRVHIHRDEQGQVHAATVIDFKTDQVDPDQAEKAAERHRAQIDIYRRATANLLNVSESVVRGQVLFVAAPALVSLSQKTLEQTSLFDVKGICSGQTHTTRSLQE